MVRINILRQSYCIWFFIASLSLQASAHDDVSPAQNLVRQTVDSFKGKWVLSGTAMDLPSGAKSALRMTLDCRLEALGAAVFCHITADVGSSMHVEAATVIGYSPEEKVVRWMEISSSGEYHDHMGPWRSDQIQFEPLPYSISGQKAVEYLIVGFPSADKMTLDSTTEMQAGKSTWKLAGSRTTAK